MIEIVEMNTAHLPALAELERACFSSPRSEKQLAEELTNPSAVFLTALCGGKIAGYCGLHFVLDEGYIDDVAVSDSFRRKGVAQALMTALEEKAARLDLAFISLEVRQSNLPAIELYSKLGYKKVGLRKNFYEKPTENGFIYTKHLK